VSKEVIDLNIYRARKGLQMPFGQKMALIRKNRGVTQEQLVRLFEMKIDRSVVSKWETGSLWIHPDSVVTVAQALHAPNLLEQYCSECPVACAIARQNPKPAA
jgi:transcriptional regulator with XRE-family HTH domain